MLIRFKTLVATMFSVVWVLSANAQPVVFGEQIASINEDTTSVPTQTNSGYHYPAYNQASQVVNNPWSDDGMEMGMNINGINYYNEGILFTDVMKSSSKMITYGIGQNPWSLGSLDSIPRDQNGWPLEIPCSTTDGELAVRIMINNFYSGDYVMTWEGEGEISLHSVTHTMDNSVKKANLTFNGNGGHVWLQIKKSVRGNHIRNIKIIPVEYEGTTDYPTFNPDFIRGLEPFTTLRFMDLLKTNNSNNSEWAQRATKNYYTQADERGMAIEYIVELSNQMNKDAWVNIPHKATDEYIEGFAKIIRDGLKPGLKVYLEYSNEIWNWQFQQAHYPIKLAPGAEPHVINGLKGVADRYCPAKTDCFPELDSWLMARTFKIWDKVFEGQRNRVVMVAGVQSAWVGNTGRILEFLTKDPEGYKPDAISGAGYFSFSEAQHNVWNAMDSSNVTPEMILDSVNAIYESRAGKNIDGQTDYAKQYGVAYIVYEGGQHMQPFEQREWSYNQSVYDAQIHPKMYDIYMKNFQRHFDADTKLFMAFSYIGKRESKWGSWGHLESVNHAGLGNWMKVAPKYQALIDAAEMYKGTPGQTSSMLLTGKQQFDLGVISFTDIEKLAGKANGIEMYDVKGTSYKLDAMALQVIPVGTYIVVKDSKAYKYMHR